MKMATKILGKILAYVGNLMAIAGLVWLNLPLFSVGLFALVVGCVVHELGES